MHSPSSAPLVNSRIRLNEVSRRSGTLAAACLLAVAFPALASAQVSPAPAAPPAPADETIRLSPFEVNSSRDVGFAAATSLAGGRLALDLKDTPAAYSVVTSEFIAALGITDLAEAAAWTPNVAPVLNSSAYGTSSDISGNPWAYSVRGAPLGSSTRPQRNFFIYAAPMDSYAAERYDFGRGPNSVLFGNASLGGISSTMTKQAKLGQRFTTLAQTIGSWEKLRSTFDVNLPLTDRLAVRAAGVYADSRGWRDREFDQRKAAFLTSTFRMAKDTTIRLEGEYGELARNNPSTNFRDFFSGWDGVTTYSGRLNSLPTDANARGISRRSAGPVYYPFGTENALMNYENDPITLSGAANNQVPIGGFVQGGLPSFEVANANIFYALNMPSNRFANALAGSAFRLPSQSFSLSSDTPIMAQGYRDAQLTFDHRIGGVFLQFAADWNRVEQEVHAMEARGSTDSYIDINRLTPSGAPNPHFLEPYTDANIRVNLVQRNARGVRLAAGYAVDARTWGRYSFSVQSGVTEQYDDQLVYGLCIAQSADHRVWGTAAADLVRRRSYWSDASRPFPVPASIRYIDPIRGIDTTVKPIWAVENNRPDSITRTQVRFKYAIVSMNAKFWRDHLVVLAAVRADQYRSYTEQQVIQGDYPATWDGTNPVFKPTTSPGWATLTYVPKDATGLALGPAIPADTRPRAANGDRLPQYANDVFKDDTNAPAIDRKKITRSLGTVVHAARWLSPYINYAETFNPPQALQRIDTSFVDPTVVKGVDVGLRFSLLKERVSLSLARYTNKEKNALVGQTISGNVNSILAANPVNDFTPAGINKRGVALLAGFTDIRDREGVGYEGEMTVNLTKGWRLTATYGKPKAYELNAFPDTKQYLDTNLGGILKQIVIDAGGLVSAGNVATIDASIPLNERSPDVNSAVNAYNALVLARANVIDGRRIIQDQPNANLFTDYTLQAGRFKGLRLGGGVQYRARPIIGYRGADTIVNPASPLQAIDDPTVDAYTPVYALRDTYNVVAVLGYTLRLTDKRQAIFDLRVDNVLNRRGPMYSTTAQRPRNGDYTSPARAATPYGYGLIQPISWMLTSTLKF